MGGAWGLARATSAAVIEKLFPEFQVVEERPAWMSSEVENAIRQNSSFVADDPQTYPDWVRGLVTDR